MCLRVGSQHGLVSATAAASCLCSVGCSYSRCHLGKARAQQQVCGLAHELPLLSSPVALRLPALKCPVHVPLCEVGQRFGNLLLLLHTAVQVASPGIKSMTLGAIREVGPGTLRFALLVF